MPSPSRAPEIQAEYQRTYRTRHRGQVLEAMRRANAKRRNGGLLPVKFGGELIEFSRTPYAVSRVEQAIIHAENRSWEREKGAEANRKHRAAYPGQNTETMRRWRLAHPERDAANRVKSEASRNARKRALTAERVREAMDFDLSFIPSRGPGKSREDIERLWGRNPVRGLRRLIAAGRLRAVYGPIAPRALGWLYWSIR